MQRPKTYYVSDHGNKEKAFTEVLKKNGWKMAPRPTKATLSLFDADGTDGRNERLRDAARHSKVVLYPHAAHPPYWYDCGMQWSTHVRLNLIMAPMHQWMLGYSGYPQETLLVGWSYCPMMSFRPAREIKRILFAPRHPTANGFLARVDQKNNANAFETLLWMKDKHPFELTVRYLHSLEGCGLLELKIPGVEYQFARADLSYEAIDKTDLVVSTQTFAYLSIARGRPTVFYGEDIPPHYGNLEDQMYWAKTWDDYKDRMIFPHDLLTMGPDPWEYLNSKVIQNDFDVQLWKRGHLGQPFDPQLFIEAMERLRTED